MQVRYNPGTAADHLHFFLSTTECFSRMMHRVLAEQEIGCTFVLKGKYSATYHELIMNKHVEQKPHGKALI